MGSQKITRARSAASPQNDCLFLRRLPPEIRCKIYSFCFSYNKIRPDVPDIESRLFYKRYYQSKNWCHVPLGHIYGDLAIAVTCRQIHHEATQVMFGTTLFSFTGDHSGFDMYKFLMGIGESNRLAIRKIEFEWRGFSTGMGIEEQVCALEDCVNLQKLNIGISRVFMKGAVKNGNIWKAYGLGKIRKMRGMSKLDLKVRQIGDLGEDTERFSKAFEYDMPDNISNAERKEHFGKFGRNGLFEDESVKEFEAVLGNELREQ